MVTMARKNKKREYGTGEDAAFQRRTVTLPPEIDSRLVAMAKAEDRPVSNLLARICREWFAAQDAKGVRRS